MFFLVWYLNIIGLNLSSSYVVLQWKLLEEGHHVLMLQPFRRFSFGAIIDRTAEAAP